MATLSIVISGYDLAMFVIGICFLTALILGVVYGDWGKTISKIKIMQVELETRVKSQDKTLAQQQDTITEQQRFLNEFVLFSLSAQSFDTLEHLYDEEVLPFDPDDEYLTRELAHLIDHGWVTVEDDVLLPEELGRLKDLRSKVELTDAGRFFVEQRRKAAASYDSGQKAA